MDMKIGLAQINPVIGDFCANASKIREYCEKARKAGCDLAVFPELSLCGYPPRDFLERSDFLDACERAFWGLVKDVRGIGVIAGYPERIADEAGLPIANAAVLFEDGEILHTAHKRLLPSYDVFDETRYFRPGLDAEVFSYKGRTLGLSICEDAWNDADFFPRRLYTWDPVEALAIEGADLIINVAASPFHAGKYRLRRSLMAHAAKKYGVFTVYVNQVGGNDHLVFDGSSTAHDATGRLVAAGADFAEDLAVCDTETGTGGISPQSETDTEALYRALVLGTRDYVKKCGYRSAVIGLSGGIDSALTAAIAAEALGPPNVTTLFMPSVYTSPDNFSDTRILAGNLSTAYDIIPITPFFEAYLDNLPGICSRSAPTLVEQNIQARIRGMILMAFSNRHGALVLSTGNKSELAVGYSTLYGDMCGGLAVISDLWKTTVYELSRYVNRSREVIPTKILTKAPSAELKADQKDQDDLPPYDDLDAILKSYLEDGLEAYAIAGLGFAPSVVDDVIRRVVRNEYKRRQAAVGLRITPKAFGEGRRCPIAHGYAPGSLKAENSGKTCTEAS